MFSSTIVISAKLSIFWKTQCRAAEYYVRTHETVHGKFRGNFVLGKFYLIQKNIARSFILGIKRVFFNKSFCSALFSYPSISQGVYKMAVCSLQYKKIFFVQYNQMKICFRRHNFETFVHKQLFFQMLAVFPSCMQTFS